MDLSREFADFYAANKDRCLRAVVASGVERSTAEEAVAEAFARAWSRWPAVKAHPVPAAWVARVALNYHVSRWRRLRREVTLETAPEPHAWTTNPAERDDLARAVAALPERQRQVVALRVFLDLDTAQTSEALGISTGTVTAHLHRAMTTLRALAPTSETTS
jgi:RNA polymerase sigma factor (sigma-70 family)